MPRQIFDGNHCQLATRIPKALHRAVKLAALEEDTPIQAWVSDALEAHLGECGGKSGTGRDEDTPKGRVAGRLRRVRASA